MSIPKMNFTEYPLQKGISIFQIWESLVLKRTVSIEGIPEETVLQVKVEPIENSNNCHIIAYTDYNRHWDIVTVILQHPDLAAIWNGTPPLPANDKAE
jgi:hypothetical protein